MLHSIRARLTLVFLGLAVGPLLIVGLLLTLNTYNVQTRETIALQREMAAYLSSQVRTLVLNLENELYMLVRIEDLLKQSPDRQKLMLSIFQSQHSAIDNLCLLNADGRVLSYHSRLKLNQDLPAQSQCELKSFKVPMSQGATYFGPVRFDELSGEPEMVIAVPIMALDTNKPEGALVANVRLKEIWDLVAKIRPGQKGSSFIVDAENRVVAHSNPSVVLRGAHFAPPGFDGTQTGLSGQESIMVSQVISFGAQQFHVVVEDPVSEALGPVIHTVWIMLTIVVVVLAAAGGFGFLMVRQIVKPIEEIAEAAQAINDGDLSRRVVVTSRDELGVLAGAFNKMTLQLETLINELEKRVADRTAQLEAANKELEAFAYSVSHDLRAPLRHIDGFIGMLRDRIENVLDDKSRHYMNVIADSAGKMGVLIDDLLSFSRMGRNEMSKARVDLNELVQGVVQESKLETEGRDIQWKIASLPFITGDRAMLRIVMDNLVANALKFTRSRPTAQIEIGCEENDETGTVIFVRDNGVGFDMAYAEKLFGVFQRLHLQEEFEGTGIGLANVRRIINRHGGRTWAEGEVDQGTTIYFSLPN